MSSTVTSNDASARTRPVAALSLFLFLALMGIALLLFATRWGIGTSPDSASYIADARLLSGDSGLWHVLSTPGSISSQRPPLYPAALAAPGFANLDPLAAARGLHALILGANLLLLGYILHRHTHRLWIAALGMLLFAFSKALLTVHAYAWSESLFLLLAFSGLYLFARYLDSGRRSVLIASSLLVGLACLTRYAGLPLIAVVAAILFLRRRARRRPWLGDFALLSLISSLPLVLWLARNLLVEGTGTSRNLSFHPIGRQHAWQALFTVTGWLPIPSTTSGYLRLALFVVLLVLVIYLIRRFVLLPNRPTTFANIMIGQPFPLLLVTFILFYGGFLTFSISFLDANTPLDDRILAPVLVAILFLGLMFLSAVTRDQKHNQALLLKSAATLLLLASSFNAFQWASFHHENGLGASSRAWQQSSLIQEVRKLPDEATIYSNAIEIVYLNAGRQALPLPRKNLAMSGLQNTDYDGELSRVAQQVKRGEALIVYFDAFAGRPVTSEPELLAQGFSPLAHADDGTIYGALAE